jgi:hypothetical protein
LDGKTRELLGELPADEAGMVAAETIVRSLGVTDGPGFEALMDALTDGSGEARVGLGWGSGGAWEGLRWR